MNNDERVLVGAIAAFALAAGWIVGSNYGTSKPTDNPSSREKKLEQDLNTQKVEINDLKARLSQPSRNRSIEYLENEIFDRNTKLNFVCNRIGEASPLLNNVPEAKLQHSSKTPQSSLDIAIKYCSILDKDR